MNKILAQTENTLLLDTSSPSCPASRILIDRDVYYALLTARRIGSIGTYLQGGAAKIMCYRPRSYVAPLYKILFPECRKTPVHLNGDQTDWRYGNAADPENPQRIIHSIPGGYVVRVPAAGDVVDLGFFRDLQEAERVADGYTADLLALSKTLAASWRK